MDADMEKLLSYFIEDTNKKFEVLHSDMREINQKLGDLQTFKIEMIASARLVSFLVSAGCGLITLLITVGASLLTTK